ncbi:hypothetical protein [Endozoicomonas euniceicola]|uniref:Uncharacterized protein n=1 Tax=Endozoicomonas euniceicola TaxID=1234143 RepID=A0ABY6GWQ8_9GAMM|nr:hypothetical protein [Endozoicomonas euniceicola]UYM17208.1 hypothetical protein NX720_04595 [Endozoicomonas euniceicola]
MVKISDGCLPFPLIFTSSNELYLPLSSLSRILQQLYPQFPAQLNLKEEIEVIKN